MVELLRNLVIFIGWAGSIALLVSGWLVPGQPTPDSRMLTMIACLVITACSVSVGWQTGEKIGREAGLAAWSKCRP